MLFTNCFIGWLINWFICSVKFMSIPFLWIVLQQMMHSFHIINSVRAFTVRISDTYTKHSNDIEQCQNILHIILFLFFCSIVSSCYTYTFDSSSALAITIYQALSGSLPIISQNASPVLFGIINMMKKEGERKTDIKHQYKSQALSTILVYHQ